MASSPKIKRTLASTRKPGDELIAFRVRGPKKQIDFLVGRRLQQRYYVLSLHGKGGMSLVYKAKDLETNQIVAVKTLKMQALSDDTVVKRFQREAEVLRRMNHPRIVQVFAYGTTERGQPFFIMDYLVGTSLGEILRTEGALDLERFQDVFVQVAAAIGHAHKHGAFHRDIKPGNIMLVESAGTSDYVKIVDFGIAKLAEEAQRLTRLGEVWGSPIYMSPEQCTGTTIDARTDIYSLGVVMYEALVGQVPFLGRNYVDTMGKQISEAPPPFSEVAPDNEIPESIERIVFKALEKDPAKRFQTMLEIKQELERAFSLEDSALMPKTTKSFSKKTDETRLSGTRHRASKPSRRTPSKNRLPSQDPMESQDHTSEELPARESQSADEHRSISVPRPSRSSSRIPTLQKISGGRAATEQPVTKRPESKRPERKKSKQENALSTLIILGVLALVLGMGLAMSDTARALLCKHLFEQDPPVQSNIEP